MTKFQKTTAKPHIYFKPKDLSEKTKEPGLKHPISNVLAPEKKEEKKEEKQDEGEKVEIKKEGAESQSVPDQPPTISSDTTTTTTLKEPKIEESELYDPNL